MDENTTIIPPSKFPEMKNLVQKITLYKKEQVLKNWREVIVWLYLRHSPGQKQDIEDQRAFVEAFIKNFPELRIERRFIDEAKKGSTTAGRDGFNNMYYLAKQEPRPADIILIWEFGRLSRGGINTTLFRAELQSLGWGLFSCGDEIPEGDIAPIYFEMINWKNKQFLIDLAANAMRGQRLLAEQGYQPTGKYPPAGMEFEIITRGYNKKGEIKKGRKPICSPSMAEKIRHSFELKAEGTPNKIVSEKTGLFPNWTDSRWSRFFRDQRYTGEYIFHGELWDNIYPEVISKKLFNAVQEALPKKTGPRKSSKHPKRLGSKFFLASVSTCLHCGSSIHGKTTKMSGRKERFYICSKKDAPKRNKDLAEKRGVKFIPCTEGELIPAETLETDLLSLLCNKILTVEFTNTLLDFANENLAKQTEGLQHALDVATEKHKSNLRLQRKFEDNILHLESDDSKVVMTLLGRISEQITVVENLKSQVDKLEKTIKKFTIKADRDEIEAYMGQQRKRLELMENAELYDLQEAFIQAEIEIQISKEKCIVNTPFPLE